MSRRCTTIRGTIGIFLAAGMAASCALAAAEPGLILEWQEPWDNVFAGREAVLHVRITARAEFKGRLAWHYAAGGRTLARQERAIEVAPERLETMPLRLPVPDVKQGLILDTAITVSLLEPGAALPAAALDKTLRVFSPNPFADVQQWLKSLNIQVFDPDHRTAATFEAARIPFRSVPRADALDTVRTGLLVVGEGISFESHRGVWNQLMNRIMDGVSVLCLAPSARTLPLLSPDEPVPGVLAGLRLERLPYSRALDKRLDAESWPPDGRVCTRAIAVRGDRGRVVGESRPAEAGGWPWMELAGQGGGRLILCCPAIIEKWETGPAPRYLLKRILEYLATTERSAP